jgi:hypothetical protein
MLPHETEVKAEIETTYRTQLEAMTALHESVMAMLTAGSWTITKRRGVPWFVAATMIGLLTKAAKTFRAVQILCERGLHDDASALVRVLMETTVAILFILQKSSKRRAIAFHAYGLVQASKMLNEWKTTPGLKRKATKAAFAQVAYGIATYASHLPPGTDFRRHWSGKANLKEALSALRGDAMYSTLYRHTSAISHGADFGGHFEVENGSDDFVWQIEPTIRGFEAPAYAARQLLWMAAHRIDGRLGLGFASQLAPHKLTRAEVTGGTR